MREILLTIRWTLAGLIAPDLLTYVRELQHELRPRKDRDHEHFLAIVSAQGEILRAYALLCEAITNSEPSDGIGVPVSMDVLRGLKNADRRLEKVTDSLRAVSA